MPTFPTILRSAMLADGFKETTANLSLRSSVDQGPAKLRRRATVGVTDLSCVLLLNVAGTQTLDTFYKDDLAGGTLPFTMTHPRGGGSINCRFKKPPVHMAINGPWFRSTLELEVLP